MRNVQLHNVDLQIEVVYVKIVHKLAQVLCHIIIFAPMTQIFVELKHPSHTLKFKLYFLTWGTRYTASEEPGILITDYAADVSKSRKSRQWRCTCVSVRKIKLCLYSTHRCLRISKIIVASLSSWHKCFLRWLRETPFVSWKMVSTRWRSQLLFSPSNKLQLRYMRSNSPLAFVSWI